MFMDSDSLMQSAVFEEAETAADLAHLQRADTKPLIPPSLDPLTIKLVLVLVLGYGNRQE